MDEYKFICKECGKEYNKDELYALFKKLYPKGDYNKDAIEQWNNFDCCWQCEYDKKMEIEFANKWKHPASDVPEYNKWFLIEYNDGSFDTGIFYDKDPNPNPYNKFEPDLRFVDWSNHYQDDCKCWFYIDVLKNLAHTGYCWLNDD